MSTVLMSDVRFAQRRRKGTWHRFRPYVFSVLALILAGILVWLIWFSTVFGVRHVNVEGEQTLKANLISMRAQVTSGEPLARVDTVSIEARVGALERVETVAVERHWPNTITIRIVERKAVAWIRSGGAIRGLDRFGVDFRTYSKAPKGLFEVRVSAVSSEKRQDSLVEAARVIGVIRSGDRNLFDKITHVNVASKDSVELILTKNRTVRWGSAGKSPQKLTVLEPLLKISARTYDVSAPAQPTTKE